MFLILWAGEEKGTGGLGRSLPVPLGSLTVSGHDPVFFPPRRVRGSVSGVPETPQPGLQDCGY